MAASQTTRLNIYTWSAGNDPFTRDQLDESHAELESRVAVFFSGTIAARPAAAAANNRGFYLATDENTPYGILYYSNGTSWTSVNTFGTPGAITPGDTIAAGTATTAARSDHQHSLPGFGTTTSSVSTSASGGAATTFSRSDHVHILANNSVTAGKIAAGGVSAANQLANNVVETAAIASQNVTRDKIEEAERIPTGTILQYAGTSAPTGWLLCNGQEVSASSALGTLLGSKYNTGGETPGNVRVPNLVSKFPYGDSAGGGGGASTVTLTASNLPTHTHAVGTLAVDTHTGHAHTEGSLANATANLAHTHSISHTHTITTGNPSGSDAIANGSAFGQVWGPTPGATGGSYNLDTGYVNGNSNAYSIELYGTWTTNAASTSTSGAMSANGTHGHAISGSVASGGSHTHVVSGDTGNNNGPTGVAVSIIPPYVGVNFIIKQ